MVEFPSASWSSSRMAVFTEPHPLEGLASTGPFLNWIPRGTLQRCTPLQTGSTEPYRTRDLRWVLMEISTEPLLPEARTAWAPYLKSPAQEVSRRSILSKAATMARLQQHHWFLALTAIFTAPPDWADLLKAEQPSKLNFQMSLRPDNVACPRKLV